MSRDSALGASSSDTLAAGLGWFSIALGVAELAAPHSVAHLVGVPPTEKAIATLRSFGAREVGSGLAILAQPDQPAWLWSRVAGDAVDLASLGAAGNVPGSDQRRLLFAAAAVLGVTALDIICARQLSDRRARELGPGELSGERQFVGGRYAKQRDGRVRVSESVTINRSLEQVEQRWSQTELLPEALRFCGRSSDGGNERAVIEFRHAPGGRGTEVRVEMEYTPQGGPLGLALAKLIGGDPTGRIRQDLRRFKQIVETGEIVLSEGPSLRRPSKPAENIHEIHKAAGLEVQG